MRIHDWRTQQTLLNGVPVTNWAPGDDVFKAERRGDIGTDEIGADGRMTLSLNPDKSGEVTIKLSQLSPTNAFLQKLAQSEDHVETFIPIVLTQMDPRRNDGVVTEPGYMKKPAPYQRGVKANVTEWTFVFPTYFAELGDPSFPGTPAALAESLG